MKFTVPSLTFVVAILLSLAVRAEVSPYSMRVEQMNKTESEKTSKSQKRSLKIFVTNSSKDPADLRAKYVFFGRGVAKGGEVVKIDEGEKAVTVGPQKTELVESAVASTTYEEEHSSGYSKGKAGKKVEASGNKFIGYGVQLYKGETMVAEYYDPLSGKDEWTKAYPAKLPTAPAKKK